jgi:hypothetical protein
MTYIVSPPTLCLFTGVVMHNSVTGINIALLCGIYAA